MSHPFPPPYAPPPKQGMSTAAKVGLGCGIPAALLTVIGILILGSCGAVLGTAAVEVDKQVKADASDDIRAAREDVEITSCVIEEDGFLKDVAAKVKVTNHGTKRANYYIQGEFLDLSGNQVDTLDAYVQNLAPGASTTQRFAGIFVSGQLDGVTKGTCKILDVSRDEFSAAGN